MNEIMGRFFKIFYPGHTVLNTIKEIEVLAKHDQTSRRILVTLSEPFTSILHENIIYIFIMNNEDDNKIMLVSQHNREDILSVTLFPPEAPKPIALFTTGAPNSYPMI